MSTLTLKKPANRRAQQDYTNFDNLPSMLNINELSIFLRISRAGAYNLINTEGFPKVTVGKKRVVIPRDRLMQWIEEN